jgi:hypothetical protein
MTNLKQLLIYLNENVDEKAISIKQAASEKLALLLHTDSKSHRIILYNPQSIINQLQKKPFNKKSFDNFQPQIIGTVEYIKNTNCGNNTYEIAAIAAENGFGPLLYDLTLSIIYPNYLTSDRSTVTKNARSVWNYFFINRSDVIKIPLLTNLLNTNYDCTMPVDSKQDYKIETLLNNIKELEYDLQDQPNNNTLQSKYQNLKSKLDDLISDNPLAYQYKIKRPKSFNSLINNHNNLISYIAQYYNITTNQLSQPITNLLINQANIFFRDKYHK